MQVRYKIEESGELRVKSEYYTGCVYITVNPFVQTTDEYHSALLRAGVTLRHVLPRVQCLGGNTFYTLLTPQEGDPSEWVHVAKWAVDKDLRRYRLPGRVHCMTSHRKEGEALDALLLRAARAGERCTA